MQRKNKRILLSFALILILIKGGAQNINISNRSEVIQVTEDSSFIKQISVTLRKNSDIMGYPIIYDTHLEEITDIRLYIKKGNQYKLVKDPVIHETDINVDFINSRKIKSIIIPADLETKVTYSIICHELMYFSALQFFSSDTTDTLEYQIKIPDIFRLSYDIINKDSLDYLSIDSSKADKLTEFNITVVPLKIDPDPLTIFGIYKNMLIPMMRTIVVPSGYGKNASAYLNDWYLDKLQARCGLDSAITQKIDDLTKGITDPIKITDTLYNYVRENFKYVAIEIGMGAFIPNHVNSVFANKQGDCKDLANFLSEILNYKGIKAFVAMAATFNHVADCDFPSLSAANHLICVAYIDDQPILLDPTDPIHKPYTPVESIQERSVFIMNPHGGEFYRATGFTPMQNLIHYEIALKADTLTMNGTFTAEYAGISSNFLKRSLFDLSEQEKKNTLKRHYESVFGNQSIIDCHISNQKNCFIADGKLSVKGKIIHDQYTRFLFIDFLPGIIENINRETLPEGIHLGNNVAKKVSVVITMDKPFETFAPIEYTYENNKAFLHISITSPSEYKIECVYDFLLDYHIVGKENMDLINEILKYFNNKINEPVILNSKR